MRAKTTAAALLTTCAFAVPATAASAAPNQVNQGNLIAALNNVNLEIDQVNVLNDNTVGDITLVNVEDVLNNNRVLNNSLNNNNVQVLQDFLNNSLNNNTVLTDFLNNNDVNIDDVVAINVLNGDIVIFQR